jgi:hypothetical protein
MRDDLADRAVAVVLRFPDQNGAIDTTDREILERETLALTVRRSADGGIGELAHPLARVTWVVPLGEGNYRLEDLWHRHPLRMIAEDEAPGGLAFRDVFVAEPLADGSLRFDRLVQKAEWRVDYWMLPSSSFIESPYLQSAVVKIEAHGGRAEQDPWIGNWLWTFLPPEADHDPSNDIADALKRIPSHFQSLVTRAYLALRRMAHVIMSRRW